MATEMDNNINLQSTNYDNLYNFLGIIHTLNLLLSNAETEADVFDILVKNIASEFGYLDCVIYKVDDKNKLINKVAGFAINPEEKKNKVNADLLQFGQGHVGQCVQEGKSLFIDDVTLSKTYFPDIAPAGSEIVVPLIINEKVFAVISSEHPQSNFYNKIHIRILETILSIASGVLVRIQKETQLRETRSKLERLIEKQHTDLEKAVEKVAKQYAKLKEQYSKQEVLLQEVHHRVTNNLQIITSILRLYKNELNSSSVNVLSEIQNKVEAMALIYQNIYKSIEINKVDVKSYLSDLSQYLMASLEDVKIIFLPTTNFDHLDLETLVSVGLFVTEVFYLWSNCARENKVFNFELHLSFERDTSKELPFTLSIYDDMAEKPCEELLSFEKGEIVNKILISALIEQIEAKVFNEFKEGNRLYLQFNANC